MNAAHEVGSGARALQVHAAEVAALLDRLPVVPLEVLVADEVPAVRDFAEQFAVDVSSISPEQRAAALAALGSRARAFAGRLYVADWVPRARRALDQLFGETHARAEPEPVEDLWPALDELWRAIARLRVLDPVSTEVLRLRQARQHACRICQSLRSRSALVAGAGESTYAQIDHYRDSDLSERHRTGLAVVDALVWDPAGLGPDLAAAVLRHYGPAESVEMVLDLLRNAANKVSVALGTDQAHVSEGVEVYDVLDDGSVAFGLSAP